MALSTWGPSSPVRVPPEQAARASTDLLALPALPTAAAGHEFTVLTADGGHVLTLAASGGGIATSIGGTLYTIATADVGKALYVSAVAFFLTCPGQVLTEALATAPFPFLGPCSAVS